MTTEERKVLQTAAAVLDGAGLTMTARLVTRALERLATPAPEPIQCPCCGSSNTKRFVSHIGNTHLCNDCECRWDQASRAPCPKCADATARAEAAEKERDDWKQRAESVEKHRDEWRKIAVDLRASLNATEDRCKRATATLREIHPHLSGSAERRVRRAIAQLEGRV